LRFPAWTRVACPRGQRVRRPALLTLGKETIPQIYWPFERDAQQLTIHVRTEDGTAAVLRSLRALARVRLLRDLLTCLSQLEDFAGDKLFRTSEGV